MSVHYSSQTRPSHIIPIALIGGPILVSTGLKKLFKWREIENTPTSKIRSAAVGKVELSGLARMRKPLKSPLSGLDCCWWQCRVQELRSNGKNSYWATIKSLGMIDFFFLEDGTGKVLVNPFGAELSVLNSTFELNPSSRSRIAPVLDSWGLSSTGWWGLDKRMRILEECLPDCAPVYLLGEMTPVKDRLADRDTRFRERLRQIKNDPELMKSADTNHDGDVDADEWATLVHQQEGEFLKEELARQATEPKEEMMLIHAPQNGSFLISTGLEEDLESQFRWTTPLCLVGGVGIASAGVYGAILFQWSPTIIVGCLALGFVISLFLNKKGVTLWSLFLQ